MVKNEQEILTETIGLITEFLESKNLVNAAAALKKEFKDYDFSPKPESQLEKLLLTHFIESSKIQSNKIVPKPQVNSQAKYPFAINQIPEVEDTWDLGEEDAGYLYAIISEDELEEDLEGCYLDDQVTTLRHESYESFPSRIEEPIPKEITAKIDKLLKEFPGEIENLVTLLGISYDGVIDRKSDSSPEIHAKLYKLLSSHFYEQSILLKKNLDDDDDDDDDNTDEEETKSVEYEHYYLKIVQQKNKTGFEMHKDFPINLGSVIANRYTIEQFLGQAAFSRAIQCFDKVLQKRVCMKIITNNKDFFDQSLDEIKLLTLLHNSHPNLDEVHLLKIYDYFYHKEHLFIVTELLRDNLYEFYKYNYESGDELYFNLDRLKKVTKQILIAMQFLHKLNLIHSDLKPENILIKSYSNCEVKVIDVGSSCFITDHLTSYVQSRSYRAPEVILGLPYGQKIDIWSVGCIVAELFTGNVLFANDSTTTLLARVNAIIGPLPPHFRNGIYYHKHYTKTHVLYEHKDGRIIKLYPKKTSLKHRLKSDDPLFLDFVSRLLKIDPAQRPSATEALAHPWLNS